MRAGVKVAVVGAGVAGLCTALFLTRRGADVALYDVGQLTGSATWAAAGMLAPSYEAATDAPEHPGLFELMFAARAHWDTWWREDLKVSMERIGFSPGPSIALCRSAGEASLFGRLVRHGRATRATGDELAAFGVPGESDVTAAFLLPGDGQVDNRRLVEALSEALEARGVTVRRPAADGDGELDPADFDGDVVVDARGWRGAGAYPVKGTAVSVARAPGMPTSVVRWGEMYVVPKADRIVVGGQTFPGLSDTSVDPAMVAHLLNAAGEVLPAFRDARVIEAWSGVRPRSRDGGPILGWTCPGVYQVGGLYRDGILLGPLLGRWAAADILGEGKPPLAARFAPERFRDAVA
ncbi:MAG: FAD-dependent oxidoreductase [Pseudomonadota bacterium]